MKTKGITIWERHAEKMVVGVAGVAFIAFAAMQFIGEPNAVQMGTDTFTPANVDETLQSEAERLEARINSPGSSVDLPDPIPALTSLMEGVDASISPRASLDQVQWQIVPDVQEHLPGDDVRFAELQVPAPTPIRHSSFTDTLDPVAVRDYELQDLFPSPDGPFDLTWVTPTIWFPLAELIEQVRGGGTDLAADVIPFPSSWSPDPHPPIVDVVFERQELVAGAWTNQTVLDPIPGQVTYRDLLARTVDAAAHDQIISGTTDSATLRDLIQPAFYLTMNSTWVPLLNPEEIVLDDDDDANEEVRSIVRQLKNANRDLARWHTQLEEAGGPLRGDEGNPGGGAGGGRDDPPRGGRGGGNSGGGGGGRREGGGNAPPGPGSGGGMGVGDSGGGIPGRRNKGNEQDLKKRRTLMEKIDKQRDKIARLEAEFAVLRPDLAEQADQAEQMLDSDLIPIWAHDLHVEAGKVYRYRAIVKVFNPAFGRKRSLGEEQQALADTFAVESVPSEWSSEVEVKSRLQIYIVTATHAEASQGIGMLGLGQATAEVYRFQDGQWWMRRFNVQPGDHIGGVHSERVGSDRVSVDYSTGYYVLDVIKDLDAPGNDSLNARAGTIVVLQDATTGERTQVRLPAAETRDSNRLDLSDTVRARQIASNG